MQKQYEKQNECPFKFTGHWMRVWLLLAFSLMLKSYGLGQDQHLKLVSQIGGESAAVAISGHLAFLGEGTSLDVIDISSLDHPKQLSKVMLPQIPQGMIASKDMLYIADGEAGLLIVDISNPNSLKIRGNHRTRSSASGLDLIGTTLFLASGDLQILDASNPDLPQLKGSYEAGDAVAVTVQGDYAYVALEETGMLVLDVKDQSSPKFCNEYEITEELLGVKKPRFCGVNVADGRVYLVSKDHLLIYSAKNPEKPVMIGKYTVPDRARKVAIRGQLAYLATDSELARIIDVSNPAMPVSLKSFKARGNAYDIKLFDNFAYVVDGDCGLRIIDVSQPSRPVLRGSYEKPGLIRELAYADGLIYSAADRLHIIDVHDATKPRLLGTHKLPHFAYSVAIQKGLLCIGSDDLLLFDVKNPAAPTPLGTYIIKKINLGECVRDVKIRDHLAFITRYTSGFEVLDISNPSRPLSIGEVDLTSPYGISLSGSMAYVAGNNGVALIDLSDPRHPAIRNQFELIGREALLEVNHIVYAGSTNRLNVIDYQNTAQPRILGACDFKSNPYDIAVADHIAYIANYDGLKAVDISKPTNPTVIATDQHSHDARRVITASDYVFVGDFAGGLLIYRKLK